ncbi:MULTISPECIES: GNAT family N-acetyltransferase [unclassified Streptomyces]|uniref:GNAT family N-acetyltransferase n=1 Tax=unclassified Streptomyces TaxID=2593676 RepID=UPI001660D020|nr:MULTISPECIES: GNAT family N-acetyltransferase [unclassified Streptomyces]MBD0707285.1 GNAT family N-acetyltransferase [Streptomyces sp. CBMA291]MBD0713773.1 GNAT family N-acetyltransferase [Streptomyces sp. CBMA370]
MEITIRKGGADDLPAILGVLDSAVVWLNDQGITAQWGTAPFSTRPKAVRQVESTMTEGDPWIAEIDGVPAGTMTLTPHPASYVAPADEPEVYVRLLATDGRFHGRGVGAALLAHAAAETRRQGVSLLRVDCFAGSEGRLIAYYENQGFTRTTPFTVEEWPGQVLERRV